MNRPTVFVIDDEAQIRALLARILQREGYAVFSFGNGADALEALERERPDLLVTDLAMPGMTGIELVRRARELLPDVGAVLTTGYASIENVVDAMRSGVDDFVTKPFSVAEIRGVVTRVLQNARPEAAAVPVKPPETNGANASLARRFRDMSVVESMHGLVADESTSAELLPRCEATIAAALGVRRAALLAPGRDGTFRVRSATLQHGPWTSRLDFECGALALIVASGVASVVDREALGPTADLLDAGAVAAAPLSPAGSHPDDAGVLVVSRPAAARGFDVEDLRVLGVVAGAMGDVFRVLRTAERAEDAYVESLCDVVEATETRSPCFARHSARVRDLSVALGRRLDLPATDLEVLDMASRLLDLGRVDVSDDLLTKVGRPNPEELRALRRHSTRADEIVRPLGRLRRVKPIIRHHHENWDGSGYPDGLRGDDIPFLAALVRITDSYAALTSDRAWRPALDGAAAVRHIVELSGRHFHPQLVAAFAEMRFTAAAGAGEAS